MANSRKTDKLYSDEISLLASEDAQQYIELNLRKIRQVRRKYDIPVICIAGTEGKTTAKRMLTAILQPSHKILETPPDCSTTSGVTATLLKLDDSHDIAILELGIVKPQQFEWAVMVAEPTIGVVTNIGEAHLATLGDKYLIADAKLELIKQIPPDGFAVLNIDDDLVTGMAAHARTRNILKFGLNQNAHFFAARIEHLGPRGIVFYVNGYYRFHLKIYSIAQIYNALSAIAVGRLLGVDFDQICDGLENRFTMLEHRGNLESINGSYILDHSYDATVNSVTRACESLVQFRRHADKLVLVVGDVSNPGPNAEDAHLKLGYYIAALPIDVVISVGKLAAFIIEGIKRMSHQPKTLKVCDNVKEITEAVSILLMENSALLLIGSKELKMSDALTDLKGLLKENAA